jgi:hypothetical protein
MVVYAGQVMISRLFLWILFGLLAVYGTGWTFLWVSNILDKRKLRRQGRIVSWGTALVRTRLHEGYFVFHKTSLGNVWWLAGEPTNDVSDLHDALYSRGTLVTLVPHDVRKVLRDMLLDEFCRELPGLDFKSRAARRIPGVNLGPVQ